MWTQVLFQDLACLTCLSSFSLLCPFLHKISVFPIARSHLTGGISHSDSWNSCELQTESSQCDSYARWFCLSFIVLLPEMYRVSLCAWPRRHRDGYDTARMGQRRRQKCSDTIPAQHGQQCHRDMSQAEGKRQRSTILTVWEAGLDFSGVDALLQSWPKSLK